MKYNSADSLVCGEHEILGFEKAGDVVRCVGTRYGNNMGYNREFCNMTISSSAVLPNSNSTLDAIIDLSGHYLGVSAILRI